MSYRLTKIYTRQGDEGYTQLRDKKISKDDSLVEVIGTIDELNSHIGLTLAFDIASTEIKECLTRIQHDLFDLGGELHLPQHKAISSERVTYLENKLDEWNATLPPLQEFVLPRGNPACAASHVARTVCRRAERCLVHLHRQVPLENSELLRYLNRLSDLLFVIARVLGRDGNQPEILWEHERKK